MCINQFIARIGCWHAVACYSSLMEKEMCEMRQHTMGDKVNRLCNAEFRSVNAQKHH